MSDEDRAQKTEDPTPKRLEEAHRKGQVAKSQEVTHWFMLAASGLVVLVFGGMVSVKVTGLVLPFLDQPHRVPTDLGQLMQVFRDLGFALIGILFLPIGVLVVAALAGNAIQHRPVFALERLKPELGRLSPRKGIKKIFSTRGVMEVVKAAIKLTAVLAIASVVVWPQLESLPLLSQASLTDLLPLIERLALYLLAGMLGVMAAMAALDFAYQKWDFFEQQKMSRQEIKDENKQSEGDPQVKARIRQIRAERGRRRMMAAVPQADVVITNPTHYAVALAYTAGEMAAPKVVAKGMDHLALRIREIAREHRVPVVENPPLARGLYQAVEVEQQIPPQFYRAVAEVIGYVMRLRERARPRRRPSAS